MTLIMAHQNLLLKSSQRSSGCFQLGGRDSDANVLLLKQQTMFTGVDNEKNKKQITAYLCILELCRLALIYGRIVFGQDHVSCFGPSSLVLDLASYPKWRSLWILFRSEIGDWQENERQIQTTAAENYAKLPRFFHPKKVSMWFLPKAVWSLHVFPASVWILSRYYRRLWTGEQTVVCLSVLVLRGIADLFMEYSPKSLSNFSLPERGDHRNSFPMSATGILPTRHCSFAPWLRVKSRPVFNFIIADPRSQALNLGLRVTDLVWFWLFAWGPANPPGYLHEPFTAAATERWHFKGIFFPSWEGF